MLIIKKEGVGWVKLNKCSEDLFFKWQQCAQENLDSFACAVELLKTKTVKQIWVDIENLIKSELTEWVEGFNYEWVS